MKFFPIILLLAIVTSCSKEVNDLSNIPKSSDLEGLIDHTKEFNKEIYTYKTSGGLIHIAVGFGIANSIMIEGEGGNIIVSRFVSYYYRFIFLGFNKIFSTKCMIAMIVGINNCFYWI